MADQITFFRANIYCIRNRFYWLLNKLYNTTGITYHQSGNLCVGISNVLRGHLLTIIINIKRVFSLLFTHQEFASFISKISSKSWISAYKLYQAKIQMACLTALCYQNTILDIYAISLCDFSHAIIHAPYFMKLGHGHMNDCQGYSLNLFTFHKLYRSGDAPMKDEGRPHIFAYGY